MFKLRSVLAMSAFIFMAGFGVPGWSYNENLAASYAQMFAPAKEGTTGKELHGMKPEALMEKIKKGEPVVGLDIRTPAESTVFTMVLPGSMSIPLNELFLPVNLARIPKDRPVVIFCRSGLRAGMAVTALRHIGFDKVFVLMGGFKALSDYLDPTTAYSPLPAAVPLGDHNVVNLKDTLTSGRVPRPRGPDCNPRRSYPRTSPRTLAPATAPWAPSSAWPSSPSPWPAPWETGAGLGLSPWPPPPWAGAQPIPFWASRPVTPRTNQ